MLKKFSLIVSFIALSSAAFATTSTYSNVSSNSDTGFYIGGQAGYGNSHWDNLSDSDSSIKSDGFAGGVFAGYDINQYLGLEAGYVYFPKATADNDIDIKTYGIDILGKITVPVTDCLGLFAKAGPGYLNSSGSQDTNIVSLAYGFGTNYKLTPNLIASASFTRFNGSAKLNDSYQPYADLYAVGLAYKFNI